MDLFRRLLQTIERLMYAVDEWLRFKSGENRVDAGRQGRARRRLVLRQLRRPFLRQRC